MSSRRETRMCPICRGWFAIRWDGLMRRHRVRTNGPTSDFCAGSLKPYLPPAKGNR